MANGVVKDSDHALVRQVRAGSRAAWGALWARHVDAVWPVAFVIVQRADAADDVVADGFLAAIGALGGFDESRPFRPWLRRIVVNRALKVVGENARVVLASDVPEPRAPGDGLDDLRGGGLLAAVQGLSPEARAVVAMRYWVDLGHEEIAETLGVAVGTVRSRLSRALADLRRMMEVVDRG